MRRLVFVACVACHSTPPADPPIEKGDAQSVQATVDAQVAPARYELRDGDDLVLVVVDEPGPLHSVAPPPGQHVEQARSTYLTATSRNPVWESKLGPVISECKSTAEFLEKARGMGLRVTRVK